MLLRLSCVTGTEHDQISHFLLALITDIHMPSRQSNAQLVYTVCAVLDFIYLARYPIHTSETLAQIDNTLQAFHDNCDIFISLGIHIHFNIPKLHNIGHYLELIELFGTANNFNTKYTECLHIDMEKEGYILTNFKDEFPQMTLWLDHKKWMMQHQKYICYCLETSLNTPLHVQKSLSSLIPKHCQQMTKHLTHHAVPLDDIHNKYGATHFIPALSCFIAQYQNPKYSRAQVKTASHSIHIPFSKLSVYHCIKFLSHDLYALNPLNEVIVDAIHVKPAHLNKYRKVVPRHFNTAIINIAPGDNLDVQGVHFQVSNKLQVSTEL